MNSFLSAVGKVVISIVAFCCVLFLLPYLRYVSYDVPESKPFAGASWYNPYHDMTDTILRANFHAHSKAWNGITWGENTAQELIDAYAAREYQVPSLSNYHTITESLLYDSSLVYVPAYEHGFNLKKVHCLCIGARDVSFLEYPWHVSISLTNHVIQNLRQHCDLVAFAHPGARNAHEPADMSSLMGLQLLEVANTQGVRTAYWDNILSHGKAVWFLANDDTHDLRDGEAFMRWNMIYAESPSSEQVISSLRSGNHYGVASYEGACEDNRLTRFEIQNDTLRIILRDTFNRLDFFGQEGGHLRAEIYSNSATYPIKASDTYVRAEIHGDHCVMYLNPVIRFDGVTLPHEAADPSQPNMFITWIVRLGIILVITLIAVSTIRLMRGKRVSGINERK